MTIKLLFSYQLFVKHVMLEQVELIVFFFLSFKEVSIFIAHCLYPMIRVKNFAICRFMHILNFMRPSWMYRPPRYLLPLNRHLTHVSYPCGQLSFLECIDIYLYLLSVLIASGVIYDLLVEPLLVLLESVGVLSFESHLHLLVRIGYQLRQLPDLFRISHEGLVLVKLIGQGRIKTLEAFFLWQVV